MISAAVSAGVTAFQAALVAAAPLSQINSIQKVVLLKQGGALIGTIDGALAAAAGGLDASDPAGLPSDMANGLLALGVAAQDQADLTNLRGLVGRAVFNLAQAGN